MKLISDEVDFIAFCNVAKTEIYFRLYRNIPSSHTVKPFWGNETSETDFSPSWQIFCCSR